MRSAAALALDLFYRVTVFGGHVPWTLAVVPPGSGLVCVYVRCDASRLELGVKV